MEYLPSLSNNKKHYLISFWTIAKRTASDWYFFNMMILIFRVGLTETNPKMSGTFLFAEVQTTRAVAEKRTMDNRSVRLDFHQSIKVIFCSGAAATITTTTSSSSRTTNIVFTGCSEWAWTGYGKVAGRSLRCFAGLTTRNCLDTIIAPSYLFGLGRSIFRMAIIPWIQVVWIYLGRASIG